ncbi:MAG: SAM-dependent methyltransferase [Silicimonas sp.]|nr:SAM-dependent methyltransferase [Silicimonas sp.]
MTPLADLIAARIRATGPMTLADYMTTCLAHPKHGYYATRDPLGAAGDFTTAPEISQMFGELIGLALAQTWIDQGAPPRIVLAELGPGRGTLMADILRATAQVPGFHDAVDLHLVETSPVLRTRQSDTLARPLTHHDHLGTLPKAAPLFLVANEFFDALPIRQFRRDENGWREVLVGLDDAGALTLGLSDPVQPEPLEPRLADTEPGQIVELCLPARAFAGEIGARIARDGGLALIIDYGDWHSRGDTFQAVEAHEKTDPFIRPGAADLTAHVDFEALAQAAAPARAWPLTAQGVFLELLGITARAQSLARNLDGTALESHIAAHRRLTAPQEMGTLFKVLALTAPDAPPPPGCAHEP